jgi:hypothetical protein
VRYFNSYGPRVNEAGYGSVIANFIRQALKHEPLTVHGDGSQTRCFTYIADTVHGTLLAGTRAEALGEAFNIGNDREIPILELARRVIELTASDSAIVHVPYRDYYGQSYEAVFKAVFAACRPHLPTDKAFARLVLAYDQPQLTWNHTPFHPNFYVDISDFLERKLAAYACHRSQVRPDPHHASLENVERLARLRGSEVSVRAAEAFYCHRCVT